MMEPRFNQHTPGRAFRLFVASAIAMISATGCGGTDPVAALNGCDDSMFVDRTSATAARLVGFGGVAGSGGQTYAPKCITVSVGQTVTFRGDFGVHPLAPGSSPTARDTGTSGNPIPRQGSNAMPEVTVTFSRAGSYPFFCEYHYAGGMLGVVRVR